VQQVIELVRRLDDGSDRMLSGLVRAGRHDQRAVEIVIVALLPLALRRRGRVSDRVDELIGELAIVVAEAARDGLPRSDRRVANVLVDRAWGQVRRPARRLHQPVPTDPVEFDWRLVDRGPDPADVATGRVVLEEIRRSLVARRSAQRATIRAWNVAVSLADVDETSRSDRVRLKYARQVLRRALADGLVA